MNLVAATVAAVVFVGSAGSPHGMPQLAQGSSERHCIAEAAVDDHASRSSDAACFDTKLAADQYLTGEISSRGLAASNTIIGTVYSDANYSGSTFTWWGSTGCLGVTFGIAVLSSGWDNQISSARAANGCWVTLYNTVTYGGARITCMPSCSSIGTLNDQVRSLVFRPQGTVG